ncbi:hypothetical protein GS416_08110 [Rhodococcus hoagii]|nr:hypothetical protein [Prescottella equi]
MDRSHLHPVVRNRHRRADRRVLPCNRGRHATRRCGKHCTQAARRRRANRVGRQQSRHHSSDRKTSRRRLTQGIAKAGTDALADQTAKYTFDPQPDPFAERFTKISNAIRKTGKNILVIVDDIDRLHSDELLSVMKAVRLLGRFDGVHYLLSYDEQTLLGSSSRPTSPETADLAQRDYLEKIVQYPFTLPPLQESHLADELRTHIGQVAQNHDLALPPERRLDGRGQTMYSALFPTATSSTPNALPPLRSGRRPDHSRWQVGYQSHRRHPGHCTPIAPPRAIQKPPKMATRLARRHLQRQIQDHRQGLAEADYRYNWSDIQDEIQATYKGLGHAVPENGTPRRHDRTRAPRGLPCQRQHYFHRYFAFASTPPTT